MLPSLSFLNTIFLNSLSDRFILMQYYWRPAGRNLGVKQRPQSKWATNNQEQCTYSAVPSLEAWLNTSAEKIIYSAVLKFIPGYVILYLSSIMFSE